MPQGRSIHWGGGEGEGVVWPLDPTSHYHVGGGGGVGGGAEEKLDLATIIIIFTPQLDQ